MILIGLIVAVLLFFVWRDGCDLEQRTMRMEVGMSALKDTLDGITGKLVAIDEKVKALVAAAQADNLAPETQAALDALVKEVDTLAADSGASLVVTAPSA